MMLIGINSILSPDLLAPAYVQGHCDEIEIVDGNYFALEHARRFIRLGGLTLILVIDAVLNDLPVGDFIKGTLFRPTIGDQATNFN